MPPRRRTTKKPAPVAPPIKVNFRTCPKGPHSKEEWVDGCEWDFCYECIHWHYLFPVKKRAPRKKKNDDSSTGN